MRVKKLHLKNGYKRFLDLTIDLGDNPQRIIALVGPNGCGKSSVLDGMLFHATVYSPVGKTTKDYTYHSLDQKQGFDFSNIQIEFQEGTFISVLEKKIKEEKRNTIFSFRSAYRYNSNLKVKESKSTTLISSNSYGASTASDIDGKMEENYRRLNKKYNDYMNLVDCAPSVAKAKIIGDLNASLYNCLDLKILSIGNIEANKGTLFFTKSDHSKDFEFNVLSSGEKEIVDILLDLYLRQDDYDETVFLFDEPELHINTSIQKKLLLEINKLVGPRCQIWLATHSIGFLRALQDELKDECQIIQFEKDVKWASSSQTLKPMKKSRAKWAEIFETALDDLTGLISPKTIVYCEGKDMPGAKGEERGFDAKVFNNIFGEKHHDTLFISSGGNTELDQRSEIAIAIMSKVFSDISILILKDRDISSGRLTTENERQVYLDNSPKNYRVLKRWEIENYLFDKEVLKAYCIAKELVFNEVEYDNFVKNINDDHVKDSFNHIRNFCGISTNISAEKFKLTLSEYVVEGMNVYKELEECIFHT